MLHGLNSLKPRAKLALKWRLKASFKPSPSSSGSNVVKGPSAHCPQPGGPTAGWPRSVVVSAIDLQATLGEVLRNSSANDSKVLDP